MNNKVRTCVFFILLAGFNHANSQTFQDFLVQVNITPQEEQMALVDSFMNTVLGFPFVEQDTLAHFLYLGNVCERW